MFLAFIIVFSGYVGDIGQITCFLLPEFFSSVMLVILGMLVMSVILHVFGCQNFFLPLFWRCLGY